jgi:N5-(cytidine 5'-diphosphoramidyl)-L-glutamine hydrolase
MKLLGITQRVMVETTSNERRDCLDQGWIKFIGWCGFLPVLLPNQMQIAASLCNNLPLAGVVLTGGNDLVALGGDAPERDETETALLNFAEKRSLPLLGVCRGMQLIQHRFNIPLTQVNGHITPCQTIRIEGKPVQVNSYHKFGTTETHSSFDVWAIAEDGTIKGIRDRHRKIVGVMWHPERTCPFSLRDRELFIGLFGGS